MELAIIGFENDGNRALFPELRWLGHVSHELAMETFGVQ